MTMMKLKMKHRYQKESSNTTIMMKKTVVMLLVSTAFLLCSGCGKAETEETSFPSSQEQDGASEESAVLATSVKADGISEDAAEEVAIPSAQDQGDASAETSVSSATATAEDVLEEAVEDPYIFYPYGTETPSGVENKIEGKPLFIDNIGDYSSDQLRNIFEKCTADTDWILNTAFNMDENTEDYTDALIERCSSSPNRMNTCEENIYIELKGTNTISSVESVTHAVSVMNISKDGEKIFSDHGYISLHMVSDKCDEGDYIIPFVIRYKKENDSNEWKAAAIEISYVLSKEQVLWVYPKKSALVLHTVHDDCPLVYNFFDPIGFLTDYSYGVTDEDKIDLEEGEYYIIDDDGTVHIFDSEGNEKTE